MLFLEARPECPIERACSDLQQHLRAGPRPLHMLTFGEALADHGTHRGFARG
jgi:hypothetical protein